MDAEGIRQRSQEQAASLGFEVNPYLPPLDDDMRLRPLDEVLDRTLCMFVVAACANGLDGSVARQWLADEHLLDELTEEEADLVQRCTGQHEDEEEFFWYVEALWALRWTLGKVEKLDVQVPVPDDFIWKFPHVHELESSEEFRRSAALRPREEVAAALDLHYRLHWAIRQRQLTGRGIEDLPGGVEDAVVTARRYALEWMLDEEQEWDEVELDT